jgi:long-subunit acyl-CoA synthetase (AMP-forming)
MYYKSPYPDIPDIPPQNFHHLLFHRQDQKEWNLDYTVHVDAVTGRQISYREFYERVMDGATALGSEKGLGLNAEAGEVVGILSENCLVSEYVVESTKSLYC